MSNAQDKIAQPVEAAEASTRIIKDWGEIKPILVSFLNLTSRLKDPLPALYPPSGELLDIIKDMMEIQTSDACFLVLPAIIPNHAISESYIATFHGLLQAIGVTTSEIVAWMRDRLTRGEEVVIPTSRAVVNTTQRNFALICNVCWHCGRVATSESNHSKCGRCARVKYCSKDCQAADWAKHKIACVSPDKRISTEDFWDEQAKKGESPRQLQRTGERRGKDAARLLAAIDEWGPDLKLALYLMENLKQPQVSLVSYAGKEEAEQEAKPESEQPPSQEGMAGPVSEAWPVPKGELSPGTSQTPEPELVVKAKRVRKPKSKPKPPSRTSPDPELPPGATPEEIARWEADMSAKFDASVGDDLEKLLYRPGSSGQQTQPCVPGQMADGRDFMTVMHEQITALVEEQERAKAAEEEERQKEKKKARNRKSREHKKAKSKKNVEPGEG